MQIHLEHLEHLDHRHPPPCAVEDITQKFQSGSPDPISAELFAATWHEVRNNPYPFYERLRTLQPICPVAASSPFQVRWYVSRFADVATLSRNKRLGHEWRKLFAQKVVPEIPEPARRFVQISEDWMLLSDPPRHKRLRSLIQKPFTQQIARMRPRIQEIVDNLITRVQRAGEMELIQDFATPVPVAVISEMLGIDDENGKQLIEKWSDELALAMEMVGGDAAVVASRATVEIFEYLQSLIEARRCHPKDDLISALLQTDAQHGQLDEDELLTMIHLLIVGGHTTTADLIGNGTVTLLRHPGQRLLLQEHPELIEGAIDEILRFESPAHGTVRHAVQDLEIHGRHIQQGNEVIMLLGAANRDPEAFTDAERMDITRPRGVGATFGLGMHQCLGMELARIEGQIAIGTLFSRLPHLALKDPAVEWRTGLIFHGLHRLDVCW